MILALGLVGWLALGENSPLRLRTEHLVSVPRLTDIGQGNPNDWVTATITLENRTNQAIRICGGQNDCMVRSTRSLPMEIPPFGRKDLQVDVRFGRRAGRMTTRIWLYTDDAEQQIITCRLSGHVTAGTISPTGGQIVEL
jgi:hypothetical protein